MMGSNDGGADEKPVHQVRVSTFEMDVTEVTVGAYRACVNAGRCGQPGTERNCNWAQSSGKENHPINCVDWNQATAYCGFVGKRLPTEEEWEYAARGSSGRKYPWGDEVPGPGLLNACGSECVSWAKANGLNWSSMYPASDGWENTAPVGIYPRGDSPFGLHDMAGNVWEWTSSGYSADYSKNRANEGRVSRGGSWNDLDPGFVRGAIRTGVAPSTRNNTLGFRCAR
ncbi:MAG TPA: SUMF1/EgtB/PvdO family nonheme iron enzyme [Polyangiaceae bacterium]|nr:SUMF1/EgtB/PvdO family nonheme iron enzyme [Polyangiaceae bacterium]